jgi:hypothetical protein
VGLGVLLGDWLGEPLGEPLGDGLAEVTDGDGVGLGGNSESRLTARGVATTTPTMSMELKST